MLARTMLRVSAMNNEPRFMLLIAADIFFSTSGSDSSCACDLKSPFAIETIVPAFIPCPVASPMAIVNAPLASR
jgi:hypothetical protein